MMILQNVHIVGEEWPSAIHIDDGIIAGIYPGSQGPPGAGSPTLQFENAIAFPGLINSHDHLDFDLFPPLANRIYNNYLEWGEDIQRNDKAAIDSVLKIPKELRISWGIFKNLLNGVTTVVNHGDPLQVRESPIDIFQNCRSLHSVGREKNWKWKLNNPFAGSRPFVIHVGEGIDEASSAEISQLIRANWFGRRIIGVHGVAMSEEQARHFDALIWCPDSNFFLLNKTARVDLLKLHTKILFGTDSTLTGKWDLWQQLREAKATRLLEDRELFDSLTTTAASVWGMEGKGVLGKNKVADLVIAGKRSTDNLEAFFKISPADILLVIKDGAIILFDESLQSQLGADHDCKPVRLDERTKFIRGNLNELIKRTREYAPDLKLPLQPA